MEWEFNPYVVPLFVGAAVMLGIMVIAIRRRAEPGAGVMALLSLSLTFYILGYAFELGSSTLEDIFFWIYLEFVGIATAPTLLFILILHYTNNRYFMSGLIYMILFIIPAITLILAWTNEQHEWLWRDATLKTWDNLTVISFSPGKWYHVYDIYTFLMIGSGIILLYRFYPRVSGLYRRQTKLFLLSMAAPLIVYIIYLLDVPPIPLDINPYALTVTALLVSVGIFKSGFLDIMPVAREAVLGSMPDSVIVLDDRHRVVDLNPAAQQLFGLDLSRIIGQSAAKVFAPWPPIVAEAEVHRSTHPRQETKLCIQGKEFVFDIYSSMLGDQPGHHRGHLIVLRDVTARALAELNLKNTNENLANLRVVDAELSRKLSVRYVMGIALDVALRTSRADAGFIALMEGSNGLRIKHCLGYYPVEMENKLVPTAEGIMAEVADLREPLLLLETPKTLVFRPDTQAQILVPLLSGEILIGVMSLETSRPEYFTLANFEAITLMAARAAVAIDNSKMYEERETLIKELDAFARTVAHDLKSPLSVLVGYSHFLKEDYLLLPAEQVLESVDILIQTSEKMNNIVDELLTLASVRKMDDVPLQPLKMADLIAGARSRLLNLIESTGAIISIPEQWPDAVGYGPWIEEVWANYLSNAIKYGGKPPLIECGASIQRDGMIRFWVKDNGQGITLEKQSKLFTEFSRLHNVRVEGHGLGLSIVQRIIDRLGGQVGVESVVGQGSTFSFTLPSVTRPV